MELSQFTDYSLRTLIYVALSPEEKVSVKDISEAYRISHHHLVKVVNQLAHLGYLETFRGRGGGIRLSRPAEEITVGEVVRKTEPLRLVECFREGQEKLCVISGSCRLKGLLARAREAFLTELDRETLADLVAPRARLMEVLALSP